MSAGLSFETATSLLATALREQRMLDVAEHDAVRLAQIATFHGVASLISVGAVLDLALRPMRRADAMWDMEHVSRVHGLVAGLSEAGVRTLVFKGEALAQTHYASSELRTRSDSDILVSRADLEACRRVFVSQGYRRAPSLPSERVSGQESWFQSSNATGLHAIDLHWRISNSPVLAETFAFEELWERSTPLAKLGACAPEPVRALMIACLHRKVHQQAPYHSDTGCPVFAERLIWLYDIHLLASSIAELRWSTVLELAQAKDLSSAVLEGLLAAEEAFGVCAPRYALSALRSHPRGRVAAYLHADMGSRQRRDLLAAKGVAGAAQYLFDIAFPARAYMRERYGLNSGTPLWRAYAQRLLRFPVRA